MSGPRILGHIDCPSCGTAKGMRITHDKNGHPFGYCEAECSQQLRIGGDERRVRKFLARYPWAAGDAPASTPAAAPVAAPVAAPAPVAPPPKAKPSRAQNAFDVLLNLGREAAA